MPSTPCTGRYVVIRTDLEAITVEVTRTEAVWLTDGINPGEHFTHWVRRLGRGRTYPIKCADDILELFDADTIRQIL